MNVEHFRTYCLSKKGSTEELPFGPDTLVFKVMGKMFALIGLDEIPGRANLKCNPERAVQLREAYESVIPGYHMNKKHWNTIILDHSISDSLIIDLIDHSYELVVSGLKKGERQKLKDG